MADISKLDGWPCVLRHTQIVLKLTDMNLAYDLILIDMHFSYLFAVQFLGIKSNRCAKMLRGELLQTSYLFVYVCCMKSFKPQGWRLSWRSRLFIWFDWFIMNELLNRDVCEPYIPTPSLHYHGDCTHVDYPCRVQMGPLLSCDESVAKSVYMWVCKLKWILWSASHTIIKALFRRECAWRRFLHYKALSWDSIRKEVSEWCVNHSGSGWWCHEKLMTFPLLL